MNFQNLSDEGLLIELKNKSSEERRLTLEVIRLLEEMDLRKVYLKLGFSSLIEFCIRELKYSESAAYRRISAMRLTRDVPHIEKSLLNGTLSLSVIAQAQTYIRAEEKHQGDKLEAQEKVDLLQRLENKSSREAEKILIERSPELVVAKERVRSLSANKSELTFVVSDETLSKLNRLKELPANQNLSMSELIDKISDLALKKFDPLHEVTNRKAPPTRKFSSTAKSNIRSRLPVSIKRIVWRQSQGQCCYQSPSTNKRCTSRFALEIDHRIPVSKGGSSEAGNLQLLCRAHNQLKGFR